MLNSISNYFYDLKRRLRIWFSYWKVTKGMYDFDYSSILEVEYHQIERVMNDIIKYQHHVNWKEDVKWMKIALNCLRIVLNKEDWYDIEGGIKEVNGKLISNSTYIFKKHINTSNIKRFFSDLPESMLTFDGMKVNLRERKAWNLYCKIRKEKTFSWWD